jgi:hypothetical protein
MKKLGLLDIKSALFDKRFRDMFPDLKTDIDEFHKNPGCACNVGLYRKILEHKDKLKTYFPTKDIETPQEELDRLSQNRWSVINCNISELEDKLRKLPKGRKQIAVARWQEFVTVIVNEMDIVY